LTAYPVVSYLPAFEQSLLPPGSLRFCNCDSIMRPGFLSSAGDSFPARKWLLSSLFCVILFLPPLATITPSLMSKIKLLYVEDEKSLHFLFRKMLPETYELFSAYSGQEALEILKKKAGIAIVVSDHRMPGITGVELLEKVYHSYPDVIRILLTAYGDREVVIRAVNEGHVFHYLQKPWDENELLLILARAADIFRLGEENRKLTSQLAQKNKNLKAELIRRQEVEKDLVEKQRQVRQLSHELLNAQERERQRIGLELHDNVAQVLSSFKLICEGMLDDVAENPRNLARSKEQVVDMLQRSINVVRGISYDLQPPALSHFGLVDALRQYAEEMEQRHGLRIDFLAGSCGEQELQYEAAINLYRLCQEAVNNSCHHGGASWIQVELRRSPGSLILSVVDNGKGFDLKKRMAKALAERRMGLRSMEERVAILQGTLAIDTAPGRGCIVRVEVPL